jgi:hypothetical protein
VAALRAVAHLALRPLVLPLSALSPGRRGDAARARTVGRSHDRLEVGAALRPGDQRAYAASPEDERHVLPARRDVREGRLRIEAPLPRGRLRRADDQVHAVSEAGCCRGKTLL